MCFLAQKNNGLVDVYFKHGVSSPYYLEDQQKKTGMDNTGVVLAEEEGAVPNDKKRNLSTESPQNKPIPVNTAKPPTNQKPKPSTNPQPKPRTNQKAKPPTNPQLKPPTNQKPKPPTNPQPKPPTNQNPKPPTNSRPCTRSVAKGKAVLQARQEGGDALSSDSYDSDEDSLYKPRAEESSSDDDGYYDNDVCKAKTVKKDIRFKHDRNAADDANVGKDAPTDSINTNVQPVEVELSQSIYSESEESQQAAEVCTITNSRPDKLPPKRKSSISPTSANAPINPMQGASSGTATRLGSILKFIPTPGFKAPRKKE
ncbi:uncharacterized protein LOC130957732 [Arachis stenosperma]|uniref:uncharacterized protein LOC130957732 n=1 Tax=Arachis stenosperma TaxID=217475 RepID=UPI0025ACF259|nr:uncharacterized protein LOC130957732 [Arachis stenosperma]